MKPCPNISARSVSPRSGLKAPRVPAFAKGIVMPSQFNRAAITGRSATLRKPNLQQIAVVTVQTPPIRGMSINGCHMIPLTAQTCQNCVSGRRIWLWVKEGEQKTLLSRETLKALKVNPSSGDGMLKIILNKYWVDCFETDGEIDVIGTAALANMGLFLSAFEDCQVALFDRRFCEEQMREAAEKREQAVKANEKKQADTPTIHAISVTVCPSPNVQIKPASVIIETKIPPPPKKVASSSQRVSSVIGSSYVPKSMPAAAPAPRSGGKALKLGAKNVSNELKKGRETAMGKSRTGGISSATAISSSNAHNFTSVDSSIIGSSYVPKSVPAAAPAPRSGGKALKLGAKNVSDGAFVQQLRNEDRVISNMSNLSVGDKKKAPVESVNRGPVLIRQSEKLTSIVSRNGGIESAEIQGNISVNINDPEFTTVTLKVKNGAVQGTQIQVHPNMDKAVWQKQQILKLKSIQKPYPLNSDVGVIRWWLVLSDEEQLPLVLNVFPNETPDGCTVNIEYILQNEALTLQNVLIAIPLAPATQPIVSEAEGSYEYIRSKSQLLWSIPIIDESNSSGNLEFSVPNGHSDQFFPVNVNFESESLVCQIELEDAVTFDGSESVEHTAETAFVVDKYEVV